METRSFDRIADAVANEGQRSEDLETQRPGHPEARRQTIQDEAGEPAAAAGPATVEMAETATHNARGKRRAGGGGEGDRGSRGVSQRKRIVTRPGTRTKTYAGLAAHWLADALCLAAWPVSGSAQEMNQHDPIGGWRRGRSERRMKVDLCRSPAHARRSLPGSSTCDFTCAFTCCQDHHRVPRQYQLLVFLSLALSGLLHPPSPLL